MTWEAELKIARREPPSHGGRPRKVDLTLVVRIDYDAYDGRFIGANVVHYIEQDDPRRSKMPIIPDIAQESFADYPAEPNAISVFYVLNSRAPDAGDAWITEEWSEPEKAAKRPVATRGIRAQTEETLVGRRNVSVRGASKRRVDQEDADTDGYDDDPRMHNPEEAYIHALRSTDDEEEGPLGENDE